MRNAQEIADELHEVVIDMDDKYQETAHWRACLIRSQDRLEVYEWIKGRDIVRGTPVARNDYLMPLSRLFLFRDPQVAMEFKLTWM